MRRHNTPALAGAASKAVQKHRPLLALVILLLLASACADSDSTTTEAPSGDTEAPSGDTEAPEELTAVRLVSPVGNHIIYAPIYIADSLGFFADEGLELEVLPSDGSSQSVQLVLAGQGDTTPTGVEAVMVGAGAEQPIMSYYEWFTAPIYGVVVAEGSPITGIEELAGGTLGITGYEAGEVPVAAALLQDVDLQFGVDVTVVPVGDELPAIIQALDSGSIDAFAGSVTDFTGLRAGGYEFRQLGGTQIEQFPGGIVFAATVEELDENRDLLIGATRAIIRGSHAMIQVPEVAQPATEGALPEAWEDAEVGQFWIETISALLSSTEEGGEAGSQDPTAWQLYADYLGTPVEGIEPVLASPIDVNDVITNDLVEEINDFDRAEVEERARQFLEQS